MFAIERMETLACTPNASLRYSQQGDTIFTLILKKQAALPPASKAPVSAAELESHRREMVARIRNLLHYQKPEGSLSVRQIVTTPPKGYRVEKLEFMPEPGIYIPAGVFLPDGANGKLPAILYVHEQGKEADGVEFGVIEGLVRKGNLIVAIDVRGVGETKPPHSPASDRAGEFRHLFDVETAMSYMAWYMDQSLFGMRVRDVVCAVGTNWILN
jgi:hypothetical protein